MGDWGRRVLQAWQGIHLGGVQLQDLYGEVTEAI